jgi:uncharacterized protein
MEIDKLCLGTVKLGLPNYGFSSQKYVDSPFKAQSLLKDVESLGIHRFDTSPRYGDSEQILGRHLLHSNQRYFVSSKIDNLRPNDHRTPEIIIESVRASIAKLKIDHLDICYLHQNDISIISDPYVHQGLKLLKEKKLIQYSGSSLYSHEECEYAIESGVFDYIQIPVNIIDLSYYIRFIQPGYDHVRFSARSLLLQGIIANNEDIHNQIKYSKEILKYLKVINKIADSINLSLTQLALSFAFSLKGIDHYLIGSTSINNIKDNIKCLDIKLNPDKIEELTALSAKNKLWSNPRNWI